MAFFTPPPIQFKRSAVRGNRPTDSDILVGELAINLRDRIIYTRDDSDNIVQLGAGDDIDSDILMLRHDFLAGDSDLYITIKAVIDSDLPDIIHDYLAGDSDLTTYIKSEVLRVLNEKDSDNTITRADHDSDLAMTYHDFQAADSDIVNTLISDIDSDIRTIYHDYQAADSDLFVTVQNVLDSDLPRIVHDQRAGDSDLRVDIDSDGLTIRHDYQAADSDLRADIDSDGTTIRHDYQAADSDLFVTVQAVLDSDLPKIIHDYQAADSDQTLGDLADVDTATSPPLHGEVLTWDSDSGKWIPSFVETISEMRRETFVATVDQTKFVLLSSPSGEVQIARNAMILVDTSCYVDSDDLTVIYVPANNNNQNMRAGDQVDITYNVSTTTTIPSFNLDGGGA